MISDVEAPTTDLINLAAVVAGNQNLPLTGWVRDDAIRAMHALGYRPERIRQALNIKTGWYLRKIARTAGVDLDEDREPDWYAIDFVCQGTPMRLHHADRMEAVRRLAPRRTVAEIAHLTGTPRDVVTRIAKDIGVVTKQPWTYTGRPARQPQAA